MSYLITNQNNFARVPYPCASYPKATVKSGGCGACAVLNCIENMTDLRFKMRDWITYVMANDGRIDGGTSIPAILKALERDYGFSYSATNDVAAVQKHLKSGGMAVFHAGGKYGAWQGLMSSEGHYICIAGLDRDNAVVIDSGWYPNKYSGAWRKARVLKDYKDGRVIVTFANLEMDKKYRTNGGVNYYLITAPTAEKDEDEEMVYKTLSDVPDWAKPAVQRRVDLGVFDGTNTTESMARIWTVEDRMNPFYETLEDVPDYWRDDVRQLITLCKIKGDGKHQIAMRHDTLKAIIVAYR